MDTGDFKNVKQMETKAKRPGSVRLNNEQYEEMKRLGFTNESTYVKFKMEQGEVKLEALKHAEQHKQNAPAPVANEDTLQDRLTIQRLTMENAKLLEKIDQLSTHQQETLQGVPQQVHTMLQEELQKRDFERLKELDQQQKKQLEKLERSLEKQQTEAEEKQKEIEELVKKLGFVELGKALLPSAISGLAKQYPTQMKGIAGTLGRLGIGEGTGTEEQPLDEQQEQLNHICTYLQEVTTPEQYQQLMQLLFHLGEQLQVDEELLSKIAYYMQQLQRKRKAQEMKNKNSTTEIA